MTVSLVKQQSWRIRCQGKAWTIMRCEEKNRWCQHWQKAHTELGPSSEESDPELKAPSDLGRLSDLTLNPDWQHIQKPIENIVS